MQNLPIKYRPRRFKEVIGHSLAIKAIKNSLKKGGVNAYILSGIRGIGKTSLARIIAKSLNCLSPKEVEPCLRCTNCLEIEKGIFIDVIEVDAATNSNVEKARELIRALSYGPVKGKKRVLIVDEVHRLSKQAFDVFLKTVEEPPPKTTFIFATTNPSSIPDTIVSRCIEIPLKPLDKKTLTKQIIEICKKEKIYITQKAAEIVAEHSEGSVRDAITTLEELRLIFSDGIDEEKTEHYLGYPPSITVQKAKTYIETGERDKISSLIKDLSEREIDPLIFLRRTIKEIAESEIPYDKKVRINEILLKSTKFIREVDLPYIALETSLIKASYIKELTYIEKVVSEIRKAKNSKNSEPTYKENNFRDKMRDLQEELATISPRISAQVKNGISVYESLKLVKIKAGKVCEGKEDKIKEIVKKHLGDDFKVEILINSNGNEKSFKVPKIVEKLSKDLGGEIRLKLSSKGEKL